MIGALFLFCIVVLSQAGTLIRFAHAPSLAICFWRLLIAGLALLPLALRQSNRRALASFSRHDLFQLVLSGLFLFTHFYFFFRSVQETTIANSTILFSLNPVTTAIGAYVFFRERVTLHLALSCLLGFAGVAILFSENLTTHLSTVGGGFWGDLWGILSAVCFTGYILTGKHIRRKLANSAFAAAIYLQTAIYAGLAMAVLGVPFTGYSDMTWFSFVLLAILPTLLGHALFTYCLNFLNVNFMSCMTLIEPILAAAVAIWLFQEPLTALAAIGFLVTCAAVVALYWESLLNMIRRRQIRA